MSRGSESTRGRSPLTPSLPVPEGSCGPPGGRGPAVSAAGGEVGGPPAHPHLNDKILEDAMSLRANETRPRAGSSNMWLRASAAPGGGIRGRSCSTWPARGDWLRIGRRQSFAAPTLHSLRKLRHSAAWRHGQRAQRGCALRRVWWRRPTPWRLFRVPGGARGGHRRAHTLLGGLGVLQVDGDVTQARFEQDGLEPRRERPQVAAQGGGLGSPSSK